MESVCAAITSSSSSSSNIAALENAKLLAANFANFNRLLAASAVAANRLLHNEENQRKSPPFNEKFDIEECNNSAQSMTSLSPRGISVKVELNNGDVSETNLAEGTVIHSPLDGSLGSYAAPADFLSSKAASPNLQPAAANGKHVRSPKGEKTVHSCPHCNFTTFMSQHMKSHLVGDKINNHFYC